MVANYPPIYGVSLAERANLLAKYAIVFEASRLITAMPLSMRSSW
jgi:hypothetical protein